MSNNTNDDDVTTDFIRQPLGKELLKVPGIEGEWILPGLRQRSIWLRIVSCCLLPLVIPLLSVLIIITCYKEYEAPGSSPLWRRSIDVVSSVQHKPSTTASLVAFTRWVAYISGLGNDSLSRHFIIPEFYIAGLISWFIVRIRGYARCEFLSAYVTGRTLVFDRVVLNQRNKGKLQQLVLLGAGFDTRAYRLGLEHENTQIFEVDIASTQERKRTIIKQHLKDFHHHEQIKYVTVDFSRENFLTKLIESGFDVKNPHTVVLFEGVTMYLDWEPSGVKSTFESLARLAPGTIIGFDVAQDCWSTPQNIARQKGRYMSAQIIDQVIKVGEKFRFGLQANETVEEKFTPLGFELLIDLGPRTLCKKFLTSPGKTPPITFGELFHVCVCKVVKNDYNSGR
jgi:methyltransferase (TIGR00027 family)